MSIKKYPLVSGCVKAIVSVFLVLCCLGMKAQRVERHLKDFSSYTKKQLFEIYKKCDRAIIMDSAVAQAYCERSLLRCFRRDTVHAMEDILNAITLKPKNPHYRYIYAVMAAQSGEYEKAIAECNEALKYQPKYAEAFLIRGWAKWYLAQYQEARTDFENARRSDPAYLPVYLAEIAAYVNEGDEGKGEKLVNDLLKRYPNSYECLESGMIFYFRMKKYNDALDISNKLNAKKTSKDQSAVLYYHQAAIYDSIGNREKACECMLQLTYAGGAAGYRYIMKQCPKQQKDAMINFVTKERKADELMKAGNFKEAMYAVNELISLRPDSGNGYYARGNLELKINQYEEAIADFLKAKEKSPCMSEPYNSLGGLLMSAKQYEDAKGILMEGMNVDPLDFFSCYLYGRTLAEEGKHKEAVEYYRYAEAINPADEITPYYLGETYAKLGMNLKACESFKKAEKLGEGRAISKRIWHCSQ